MEKNKLSYEEIRDLVSESLGKVGAVCFKYNGKNYYITNRYFGTLKDYRVVVETGTGKRLSSSKKEEKIIKSYYYYKNHD